MIALIPLNFLSARCLAGAVLFPIASLILALLSSTADAAMPNSLATNWVRQFGTDGQDVGEGVSADPYGDVYVSGFVSGTLSSPYAGGFTDAFLRKYNSSGSLVWSRQFGTDSDEEANSTSTDNLGNVYVSGWTRGNLASANLGSEDAFLAKYDPSGTQLWIRQLGTNSNDYCYGVSADGLGNAYITGYTNGSLAMQNTDGRDMFVAQYDAVGNLNWTRQFSPNAEQAGFGVSGDSDGNVYVTGYTGDSRYPGGIYDPFVNKYDVNGTLLWTRQLGTTHQATSSGVSVDGLGNVYITGRTSSNLGGGPIVGEGDVFVAKYNESGDLQWVRQMGTSTDDVPNGVSTDGLGNVFVAGYTNGSLAGSQIGSQDAFVLEFDSAGNLVATAQIGTNEGDRAYAVSSDHLGSVYLAGYTSKSFLDNPYVGTIDAFVAKLTSVPEPAAWLETICAAMLSVAMAGRFRT